jgi:hypothetical protein
MQKLSAPRPFNDKAKLFDVPAKSFAESKAYKFAEMYGLLFSANYVLMEAEQGGNFIYDPYTLLPSIVMLDGGRKVYKLDWPSRSSQDGSDIPLFQEILLLAYQGQERDDETCDAIIHIQRHLVSPIIARLIAEQKVMTPEAITDPEQNLHLRELRHLVIAAEFNACTIWREGKVGRGGKDASA